MKDVIAHSRFIFALVSLGVILLCQAIRLIVPEAWVVLNPGIAFGLNPPPVVTYITSILLIAGVSFWFYKTASAGWRWAISLALVIGGGTSNLFDRVVLDGFVVDYIHFGNLGVVNLADIFIALGVIATLLFVNHAKT